MAIATRITRPCNRCGQPVEATLHQSYVIEDDASLRAITDDRFHLLDCAQCGERRAFEADFLVVNKPRDLFVQVISKDEDVPAMIADMKSLLGEGQVFARIVPGRAELVEKIKLHTLRLDDVAIEVMKFLIRGEIKDFEGKTRRHFDRVDGEDLVFRIRPPGEPPRAHKVPVHVYRNLVEKLGTRAHAGALEVDERLARKLLDALPPLAALADGGESAPKQGVTPAATSASGSAKGPPVAGPFAPPPALAPPAIAVVAAVMGAAAASHVVATGSARRCALHVSHAGTDRRGRRFVSDGKIILLGDLVTPAEAPAPTLLTTEVVDGLVTRKVSVWTPLVALVKSKLHASCYRTSDDIALGEAYVDLLLGLGRSIDLGTTDRLGPVILREGNEIVGTLMPLNLPPEKAAAPPPGSAAIADEVRVPCPICQGLIPQGDRFCEACGVGLLWKQDGGVQPNHPELLPGRVLVSESFEHRPFPGRAALTEARGGDLEGHPVPGGKLMTYRIAVTSSFVDYARPLRDACVRATFIPYDPGARIGLCARHSMIGKVQMYYLLDLMPMAGRAWCSRGVQTPEQATSTRLGDEVKVAPIPIGVPIELELRIAGSTLRAYVNRQLVIATHDAAFGAGGFGVRVGRESDITHPVRILCQGWEVREVLP